MHSRILWVAALVEDHASFDGLQSRLRQNHIEVVEEAWAKPRTGVAVDRLFARYISEKCNVVVLCHPYVAVHLPMRIQDITSKFKELGAKIILLVYGDQWEGESITHDLKIEYPVRPSQLLEKINSLK